MSLRQIVRKITKYKVWRLIFAFWYAKILAHVRDHVRRFYSNCRTLTLSLKLIFLVLYFPGNTENCFRKTLWSICWYQIKTWNMIDMTVSHQKNYQNLQQCEVKKNAINIKFRNTIVVVFFHIGSVTNYIYIFVKTGNAIWRI